MLSFFKAPDFHIRPSIQGAAFLRSPYNIYTFFSKHAIFTFQPPLLGLCMFSSNFIFLFKTSSFGPQKLGLRYGKHPKSNHAFMPSVPLAPCHNPPSCTTYLYADLIRSFVKFWHILQPEIREQVIHTYPSCLPRLFYASSLSLVLPTYPFLSMRFHCCLLDFLWQVFIRLLLLQCHIQLSIQKAAMDPLLCFAQSSSFNLLATLAAYQLPPRIYLSLRRPLVTLFAKS